MTHHTPTHLVSPPLLSAGDAADCFALVGTAVGHAPDYRRVYGGYAAAIRRLTESALAEVELHLVGTFARLHYLLERHGASPSLRHIVHDARVRVRDSEHLPAGRLESCWRYDMQALCMLIALVGRIEVPAALTAQFPDTLFAPREAERADAGSGRQTAIPPAEASDRLRLLDVDCVRLIVSRWDSEHIWGQCETPLPVSATSDGSIEVNCRGVGCSKGYDWSRLSPMLSPGRQLNIVRPWSDGHELYPELIVVEPDYLVDISAVARCFAAYAQTPLIHLLTRLDAPEVTEAILLGQFASQLLDEEMRPSGGVRRYADRAMDFFHRYALQLAAVAPDPSFHDAALTQLYHIRHALHDVLPQAYPDFDPADGVVEPSFLSEMLGLQGRMDYLHRDFRFLIEQKSGKGAWPQDDYTVPRHTEEHYAQMVLYALLVRYNHRDVYEAGGRQLRTFLLYSRYSEPLLAMPFAPAVAVRAVMMRNSIAWRETQAALGEGYDILARLTPEDLFADIPAAVADRMQRSRLWQGWVRPHCEAQLGAIRRASPLERAYYLRFMRFVHLEHYLAKVGTPEGRRGGQAAMWHTDTRDKLEAGDLIDRLVVVSHETCAASATTSGSKAPGAAPDLGDAATEVSGEGELVVLGRDPTAPTGDLPRSMPNFRTGDRVIFYPYAPDRAPDARRRVVYRGHVVSIDDDRVTLHTPGSGVMALARAGDLWAVEHDFIESSFTALYRSLHALFAAPRERRDLLLGQRTPLVDTALTLREAHGAFDELALRVRQARDLFLIVGPPGTGKTSFGLITTLVEELHDAEARVLLTACTHRAVDEICGKLVGAGIDFVRIGSEAGCAPPYVGYLLERRARQCADMEAMLRLLGRGGTEGGVRVYVGTSAAFTSQLPLLSHRAFTLAVVDEASQLLEPQLMGLLAATTADGSAAIRRFVLIGDHRQLPAVVQQSEHEARVDDPLLRAIGVSDCRMSFFERMLRRYADDPRVTYMLTRQGRMHPDVARFCSETFYGGRLVAVPLAHQQAVLPATSDGTCALDRMLATQRLLFFAVDPTSAEGAGGDGPGAEVTEGRYVNLAEAELIAAVVWRLYKRRPEGFDPRRSVGVIVPYRAQAGAVLAALARYPEGSLLRQITVDTVERYQGSQRRQIVYGFTVKADDQLRFLTSQAQPDELGVLVDRKLNVAMTRAEEQLIMVGWPRLLETWAIFRSLIAHVRDAGGYCTLPLRTLLASAAGR